MKDPENGAEPGGTAPLQDTIVTCSLGRAQAVVKMDKSFDIAPDAPVGIRVEFPKICLFDGTSGERLRALH